MARCKSTSRTSKDAWRSTWCTSRTSSSATTLRKWPSAWPPSLLGLRAQISPTSATRLLILFFQVWCFFSPGFAGGYRQRLQRGTNWKKKIKEVLFKVIWHCTNSLAFTYGNISFLMGIFLFWFFFSQAALIAARNSKEFVSLVEFESAIERVIGGIETNS